MKYIPQAPPFVMIDEVDTQCMAYLLSTNESETITRFEIKEGHLFVENNQFTEPGLIENMAQSAAAGIGVKAAKAKKSPPVGFIGQIKNLEIYQLPEVGKTIITKIKNKNKIMNVWVVTGCIECDGEKIAEAEFKIFLQ